MAAPVQAYWWRSSLTRVQVRPRSSDRKIPRTPRIRALLYIAGYRRPGAAFPKPIVSASSTPAWRVNVTPPSVECHSPYVPPAAPPANQISPAMPGTALNRTFPVPGRPVAGVAVNVAPLSALR
jgi:hypothetical protein